MLKMYHTEAHAGSTPDYWEANWEDTEFELALKFCSIDPLRPLFEKYSRPGSLMLEGGCGMGQYLAYYAALGRRVIGLDFARNTLHLLHLRQPQLPLCCGDVSRLPFADETFDLYYSGGVVEHFEAGAEDSLREAGRVLKKDGILLISVPYFSPLRKVLLPFKQKEWRKIKEPEVDLNEVFAEKKFFQYVYTRHEFEKMLGDAGLSIKETQGYSILWGLYDIPFVAPKANGAEPKQDKENSSLSLDDLVRNEAPVSFVKRLVVSEDVNIPLLGWGIRFMRWSSANLMMYVCSRK